MFLSSLSPSPAPFHPSMEWMSLRMHTGSWRLPRQSLSQTFDGPLHHSCWQLPDGMSPDHIPVLTSPVQWNGFPSLSWGEAGSISMDPPLSKPRKRDAGRPLWVMGDQCDGLQNDHMIQPSPAATWWSVREVTQPLGKISNDAVVHPHECTLSLVLLSERDGKGWTRSKAAFTLCVSCVGRQALYPQHHLGSPPLPTNTLSLFQLTIHIKIIC